MTVRIGLLVALLIAGGAVSALLLTRNQETSASVVLDEVPPDVLGDQGYELRDASGATAAVSMADAELTARVHSSNGRSRQTTLARLTETREPYRFRDRLVWVVNLDPATVPPTPACGGTYEDPSCVGKAWPVQFYLVFLDADTGEFLFVLQRGDPSGPQPIGTQTNSPTR